MMSPSEAGAISMGAELNTWDGNSLISGCCGLLYQQCYTVVWQNLIITPRPKEKPLEVSN